jgi:ABC-type uncharacterized transport system permease subunit
LELEKQILSNVVAAEQGVRLGLAAFFGLALCFNALLLLRERRGGDVAANTTPSHPQLLSFLTNSHLQTLARVAFQAGVAALVAYGTLALISPFSPVSLLVYLGIALVLAMGTLYTDRPPRPLPALSFLSSGIIWLLAVAAAYFTPQTPSEVRNLGMLAGVHVLTATLASGLFVAAFLASLLYLISYRWLKSRKLERKPALPSLEFLDNLVEKTSVLGLLLITTSLVSGLGLLFTGFTIESVGLWKILWAFAVWGLYSVSIFGRGFWGWRGRKGAIFSVWGTLLIASSLFGTLLRT